MNINLNCERKIIPTSTLQGRLNTGENLAEEVTIILPAQYGALNLAGFKWEIQVAHLQNNTFSVSHPVLNQQAEQLHLTWNISSLDTSCAGEICAFLVGTLQEVVVKFPFDKLYVNPGITASFAAKPDYLEETLQKISELVSSANELYQKACDISVNPPKINPETETWMVWNTFSGRLEDTGISAKGPACEFKGDMQKSRYDNSGKIEAAGGILQAVYPVGSYYISSSPTSPAVLFGFGTWVRAAAGKMVVGVDTADDDFKTAGKTGGQKNKAYNLDHSSAVAAATFDGTSMHWLTRYSSSPWTSVYTSSSTSTTASKVAASRGFALIGNTASENIMNPYETAYIWKRTA